jgi:tRNA A37 N6-isopentenylltransferase MiaA
VWRLGQRYGWDSPAFGIIGYRAMKDVVLGSKPIEEGVDDFIRADVALYKKQMTWFKRNKDICWIPAGSPQTLLSEAMTVITAADVRDFKQTGASNE